jgi:adenylate cyclase
MRRDAFSGTVLPFGEAKLSYCDSASFFTRASTGRPVFSLAATAALAAALRTERLRISVLGSDVIVILLPDLTQGRMFGDHLHNIGVILGCQCRLHQPRQHFPAKLSLRVVGAECAFKGPRRASPPLAALVGAVLLLPRDDDTDGGSAADHQRHPCLCGHADNYRRSGALISAPEIAAHHTDLLPGWNICQVKSKLTPMLELGLCRPVAGRLRRGLVGPGCGRGATTGWGDEMTVSTCGSCGTQLRPSAKFCDECGTPTTTTSGSAEYKQVTVLFADVVRSMDVAAAVDPERLRDIMSELLRRSTDVVHHYGGTVDKFTGDGVMALFGAPSALEDHAVRACLAALGIHREAGELAEEVKRRDGITLVLRIGLNSGRVIAGTVGSGPLSYTAIGEQVGMAQRMESAAPPGGVMLTESTASLVERSAVLGERELVQIKGRHDPVVARRLLRVEAQRADRVEARLVGRRWEITALDGMLQRVLQGRGAVVALTGPAGIGKSRLARELAAVAAACGVDVFSARSESHATEIPFTVVARLLRSVTGVCDLDADSARATLDAQAFDGDEQDRLLLDDLLGIRDPAAALPAIDPDARRRRLTALITRMVRQRAQPTLYVVGDVQWIDPVSESMLTELLTVIPKTRSMLLISYRPEYRGMLIGAGHTQSIALGELGDSESAALMAELLGTDPSVLEVAAMIARRAAGNPFFAEEMVRDLGGRGVLQGQPGAYVCTTPISDVSVPATVQAAIAARIDRLPAGAKKTLSAAAAIGERFTDDLLVSLGVAPIVDELIEAEFIDEVIHLQRQHRLVGLAPPGEYAFHQPLIRVVAYESVLKSERDELHRRQCQRHRLR